MYLKMLPEIIEALESYYCDEKDLLVDCIVYLKKSIYRQEDAGLLEEWLDKHDRCSNCGEPLEHYTYKEYHNEVDNNSYEIRTEKICPFCFWKSYEEYK